MASSWLFKGWLYTAADGSLRGPISTTGLRSLVASGQLRPQDTVWWQSTKGGQTNCIAATAEDAIDSGMLAQP